MSDRIGDWMCTASGVTFYPLDPRPEEIRIEDIAHSLALQCRFAGHCREFYSVAEHSVRGAQALRSIGATVAMQAAFLLHDASEAYAVDLPRPIKRMMPNYKAMEKALERAIYRRFGLSLTAEQMDQIKWMDNAMLATEKRDLMRVVEPWSPLPDPLPEQITPWAWETARSAFLGEWGRLAGMLDV